jgi:hypothetical protein
MKGSGSVVDNSQSGIQTDGINNEIEQKQNINHEITAYEKLAFQSKNHRNSVGSAFGNYSNNYCINQTLSPSRDVLTAIVTPTEHENNADTTETPLAHSNKVETDSFTGSETTDHDTQTDNEFFNRTDKQEETKTWKPRPPPPSYPPPPLPPSVLIYV